jgi:hypothetical protein
MPTTLVSTSYRPVKIGFVVREDSIDDLVTAAGINTLLCGGVFNPFIPIPTSPRLAENLIKLFKIDVLYPVNKSADIVAFLEKHSYLRSPNSITEEEVFYKESRTQKQKLAYLDCINLIEYFWERDFKHKRKKYKSAGALVTWDQADPLKDLFALSFGYFPTTYDLFDDFTNAFLKGLRAKTVEVAANAPLPFDLIDAVYPMQFTASELGIYGGPLSRNGIYVGDETDFYDLYTFWNLRATGSQIQFVPKNHTERFEQFIKTHLANLDAMPNHPSNIDDMISVHYRRDDFLTPINQEVVEIAKQFEVKKPFMFSACSETSWNGLNLRVADYDFGRDSATASVDQSSGSYKVEFNLQEKPPVVKNAGADLSGQNVVFSIHPYTESFNYPNHTLKPPFLQDLNEFYSRQISGMDPWKLRVQREGVGIIISANEKYETLYPISHQDLIQGVFKYAGIDAKLSKAGRLALRIIEKFPRFAGVGGFVLRVRGVRDLLQKLKADESINRVEAKKRIWAGGQFNQYQKEWRDANQVFDHLLDKGFFRAGLELQCDHCTLKSWLSLREIDDFWTCTYCGNQAQTSPQLKGRGDWKFRKSGLFSKANNQEGAVPVILTLLKLYDMFGSRHFIWTPSLDLILDSKKKCEIDLCVMQYEIGRAIELGIAECKSERGEITREDVDNLKLVRDRFKDTDIEGFLIFSKTADQFSPDEMSLFRELAKQQIPCVLLLNRELERQRLDDYRDKQLPRPYAHTLRDMSINSFHRYLKDPASAVSG